MLSCASSCDSAPLTARATTDFVRELEGGDLVRIEGGVRRLGTKSVTFALRMRHVDTGQIHATCEIVEVFFDPATRVSASMPAPVREALTAFEVEA